jgi:hypothetical protein
MPGKEIVMNSFVIYTLYKIYFSFSFLTALPAHSGPWSLIQFRNNFLQTVGLLGRVISPSHGLYLNTGQHKRRTNTYTHQVLSGVRTHDPRVRRSEDSSCLIRRDHCDYLTNYFGGSDVPVSEWGRASGIPHCQQPKRRGYCGSTELARTCDFQLCKGKADVPVLREPHSGVWL